MAFPDDPLDVLVELQTAGQWADVTEWAFTRDPITISYGRADEGQRVDPGRATISFNNRDGRFSASNPRSPYYGLIGRNTPVRVSVPGVEPYLELTGETADTASTPDASVLDIVGDIDVRYEATVDWQTPGTHLLMGKYSTINQASWLLYVRDQFLRFQWSTTGADAVVYGWQLPPLPGRAAVRVVLDVNNGASHSMLRMYTAPSIAGPWTQFSVDADFDMPVTSIFSGSSPLVIGVTVGATPPLPGRVHKVEIRNSAGTVVANPDFTVQDLGDTSFVDAAGRTWTVNGEARISDREYRFKGEISAWPPKWDVSGEDVWVPIEAGGILRRLSQGRKPLASTLARRIPTQPNVLAYWPLEEGTDAKQASSPIPGVSPLRLTSVTWASANTLPSSSPLPVLASNGGPGALMSGAVPAPKGATTGWQVRWLYRLDTAPTTLYTFMRITGSGTVKEWYLQSRDTQSRIIGRDAEGADVVNQSVATGADLFNQWNSCNLHLSQSGGTVSWRVDWQDIGGDAGGFGGTYSGTAGRVTGVASPPDGYAAQLDGMALGHIAVISTSTTAAYDGAITGYAGETAINRMLRLASETDMPLSVYDGSITLGAQAMGPQLPTGILDLVFECADTDGGILYEPADAIALRYRDRTSLYNQTPALVLDYAAEGEVAPPLEPVEDDQHLRNDVTVERSGGSSGRVVIEEGPLSVLPPEEGGVGIYDETVTLNLATDEQTEPIAGWRAHLGTWPGARYPSVHVQLHTATHLIGPILGLRIGDKGVIEHPPEWLPPEDIEFLTYGYTEVLDVFTWDWTANAAPAGPWNVAVVGESKVDTAGSALAAGIDADDVTLSVALVPDTVWVDSASFPADFPIDVRVGGEVMRVTKIVGTASPQTFTVTRSINGIVKSHAAGAPLSLAYPATVAL